MTETNLVQVDNDTLVREFQYFRAVCEAKEPMRQAYIQELDRVFQGSDKRHEGSVDREEFQTLFRGYFEMKGIQPTKENFDQYFEKLDVDHDQRI